jgi:hypothetical protein
MNCANHPGSEVTAYCQQCGKPMCGECVRSVGGLVLCEPCLGARLGVGPGQTPPIFPTAHPNPVLAGLLGFIPGVGSMYNGQFIKALVHVLVFAVLVTLTSHANGLFGLFVAAWVLYQVFDAYQTAEARRDGLPLPNPFGLNDLGAHFGPPSSTVPPPGSYAAGFGPAAQTPGAPYASPDPPSAQPQAGQPPYPQPPIPGESPIPTGAIVLIAVGFFLLLETLGILRAVWIGRSWPLLFVALGVWLALRGRHPNHGGGAR